MKGVWSNDAWNLEICPQCIMVERGGTWVSCEHNFKAFIICMGKSWHFCMANSASHLRKTVPQNISRYLAKTTRYVKTYMSRANWPKKHSQLNRSKPSTPQKQWLVNLQIIHITKLLRGYFISNKSVSFGDVQKNFNYVGTFTLWSFTYSLILKLTICKR